MEAVFETRTEKAIVRLHGTTDQEKLKEVTIRFLKQVEYQRKKVEKDGK